MRIKKFKNNEYIFSDGIWIRNMCKDSVPLDINQLGKNDLQLFLHNECENIRVPSLHMDEYNPFVIENAIICSDGYKWKEKQKILGELSNNLVKVIGVNGSLAKWEMVGEKAEIKRTMTFYLVNNPYPECMRYLPKRHKYYPHLVASTKTNPNFIKEYRSDPFFYKSSQDLNYSGIGPDNCIRLDDYRNPICAAVSFAWSKGARKIALLCCDESFEDERPGAIKMKNGLYQYPQQIIAQNVIDSQFYWLKEAGVKIIDCSSGIEYKNAEYISIEGLGEFFEESDE